MASLYANRCTAWLRWRMRHAARFLCPLVCRRSAQHPVRSILCLVSGGIGDRLMALPALRRLKKLHPKARLCVVWLDGRLEVVNHEFNGVTDNGRRRWLTAMMISAGGWDVVFVSQQGVFSVLSEWCALLSRAPVRIGPVPLALAGHRTVYSHPYLFRHDRHATTVNLQAVDPAADASPAPYPIRLTNAPSPDSGRLRIGLHPCAGKGYEIKRWPLERWRELIVRLHAAYRCDTIVIAGPGEERYCASVKNGLSAQVAAASCVAELFRIAGSCRLIVAADSGPAHCAAALGIPLVVIFGPTDPARVGPVGPLVRVIQAPCSHGPCFDFRDACVQPQPCMAAISPEQILTAASAFLS